VPPRPRSRSSAKKSPASGPKALARLFEQELKTPAARKAFFDDPSVLKELGLPRNVAAHLEDLSYEELRLLAKTWQAMDKGDLTYNVGGVRVSFL
jgi:hypothetical protein